MDQDPTFTGLQAAHAQSALRAALGLPPEKFPLEASIGMISEKIEQLRMSGKDEARIATLVSEAIGTPISPEEFGRFYASPEARDR